MKAEGIFTKELWQSIEQIYAELLNHPFVNQLAQGTLPHANFAHYLAQDILYIKDDAIAYKYLSKKATLPQEKEFFDSIASDTIFIEQDLHNHYLKAFNVEATKIKSPVIEEYTRFLIHHSKNSSYAVAAAALLPCFWVYTCVGKYIYAEAAPNNKYQKWIDTYKGETYGGFTQSFIKIVERLGSDASNVEKEKMKEAFFQSSKLELDFFEESILQ